MSSVEKWNIIKGLFLVRIKLDNSCGSAWHLVETQKLFVEAKSEYWTCSQLTLNLDSYWQKTHELIFYSDNKENKWIPSVNVTNKVS